MSPAVSHAVCWTLAGLVSAAYVGALIALGAAIGRDGPRYWGKGFPLPATEETIHVEV